MNYSAILFDMDGTLLDTSPLWNRATRIALAANAIFLTEEEHLSLGGTLLEHLLTAKGYPAEIVAQIYRDRDAALLPVMEQEAAWVTGMEELLTTLNVPKAIITSSHANILNGINRKLALDSVFDTIVMAEDVMPDYKPHPKGLLLACQRLGVDPASCVYVGDQRCDLEAAANAGMDAILIKGRQTPNNLIHEKVVKDAAELRVLLS